MSLQRSPLRRGTELRSRPRDTGPDRKTREAVYKRDGWRCVCCGTPIDGKPHSLGHRQRRSQGGRHTADNLLTFLGWGNGLTEDDHHYRIDTRKDPRDEENGYSVRSRKDPASVPVRIFAPDGSSVLRWPAPDGEWAEDAPEGAVA